MFFYKFKVLSKQSFFPFFYFLAISVIAVSCTPKGDTNSGDKRDRRRDTSQVLEDGRGRDNSKSKCSQRDSYSEEISIRNKDLDFVDSGNAGEYELEGNCETRNALVYVRVNGYPTTKNPKCDKGRWKVTLNLSTVASREDSIVFYLTHNKEDLCKEVRVAFLGPANYIPITSSEGRYESSFYVMKYEAKIDGEGSNARAKSAPEGKPISRVSYEDALKLCRNAGSRFDLIQNSQWQEIALSIEEMDENWSQGRAIPSDGNILNCGVSRGSPKEALNDCAVESCDPDWDENKRTHILPGPDEEKIWDMCGNVSEMMKDKYRANENFRGYIYQLSSDLKELFGPKTRYSVANARRGSNTWNLGYVDISRGNDLIVRGSPGNNAGIFSVDVTNDQDKLRSRGNIGFRCVYIP